MLTFAENLSRNLVNIDIVSLKFVVCGIYYFLLAHELINWSDIWRSTFCSLHYPMLVHVQHFGGQLINFVDKEIPQDKWKRKTTQKLIIPQYVD